MVFSTIVSNLPAEIAHILEEIRDKDLKFYEIRKKIQQRDNQIHKFIRTNGSLAENPKEQSAYPKIRNDFERAAKLQSEKCDLAILGLYAISKHLRKLQDKIKTLEDEGYVPPEEILTDHSKELCEEISNHTINPIATTPIDFSILSEDLGEHNPLLRAMLYAAQTRAVNAAGVPLQQSQNNGTNGSANGTVSGSSSASSLPPPGYRNPATAINHSLQQHLANGVNTPNAPAPLRQTGATASAGRGTNNRHSRVSTGGSQSSHTKKHSTLAYSRSATPGNASSREGSVSDIGNGSTSSNITKEKSAGFAAASVAAGTGSANGLNLTPTGRPSKRQKTGHSSAALANQGASATPKSAAGGSSGRQSVKAGSYASSRNATPSNERTSSSGTGAAASTKSRKGNSGSSTADTKHTSNTEEVPAGDSVEADVDAGVVQEGEDKVYCVCRQVSFGNMVACDNDECPYEWFHWDCVGLVEPPQGTWYCPTCTKAMKEKEHKKRSRS